MKILVVDDVGYSRHYHTRLVQKFGHEAIPAESGEAAMRILEQDSTVNVVLTDLIMRGMDGLGLFRQSQQIQRISDNDSASPPVFILMTALRPSSDNNSTQQKDLEKLRVAKEIGFAEVLFKPIESDHLKKLLETMQFARGKEHIDVTSMIARFEGDLNKVTAANDPDALAALYDGIKPLWGRLEEQAAALT